MLSGWLCGAEVADTGTKNEWRSADWTLDILTGGIHGLQVGCPVLGIGPIIHRCVITRWPEITDTTPSGPTGSELRSGYHVYDNSNEVRIQHALADTHTHAIHSLPEMGNLPCASSFNTRTHARQHNIHRPTITACRHALRNKYFKYYVSKELISVILSTAS